MVPPLAMALSSTVLAKKKYTRDERESGKTAWILGLSFISELSLIHIFAVIAERI